MDLFTLVEQDDCNALKTALADRTTPDTRNDSGDTPLIIAAARNAVDIADCLLDAGADINLVNDFGFSALSSALWENHLSLARSLVAHGAEINPECAAALGDLARLETAWFSPPQVGEMIGAYLSACRTGQSDVIRWFLDHGIAVDMHPPGEEWGGVGCPGLHHAAVNGHHELVQLLLSRGADHTLTDDSFGSQALAWAASTGQEDVVSILVTAGANTRHKNFYGLTAADLARESGFLRLAQWLEDRPEQNSDTVC